MELETQKTEDGKYECPVCGETFEQQQMLAGHMNKHRDTSKKSKEELKEERLEKEKSEEETEETEVEKEEVEEVEYVPPAEMTKKRRLKRLKSRLPTIPKVGKKYRKWIKSVFKSDPDVWKDPNELYKVLVHDTKCPPTAAHRVVSYVFKDLLERRGRRQPMPPRFPRGNQRQSGGYKRYPTPQNNPRPSMGGYLYYPPQPRGRGQKGELYTEKEVERRVEEKLEEMKKRREEKQFKKRVTDTMKSLQNEIQRIKEGKIGEKKSDIEKFKEWIKLQEMMSQGEEITPKKLKEWGVITKDDLKRMKEDQRFKTLKKELERLRTRLRNVGSSTEGYKTDDARLVAEGLNQVGKKMNQMHETVKTAIANLPKAMRGRRGRRKRYSEEELREMESRLEKKRKEEGILARELGEDMVEEK